MMRDPDQARFAQEVRLLLEDQWKNGRVVNAIRKARYIYLKQNDSFSRLEEPDKSSEDQKYKRKR